MTGKVAPELLRTQRTQRGWTTDELAQRLGMPQSGSIVTDWEEGRRILEGPMAGLVLSLLRSGSDAETPIEARGEQIWRRSGNWRESWRQITALPLTPAQIDAETFAGLFPRAAIPPPQHVHGFPFVDHGLPSNVYGQHGDVWLGVIPQRDAPPAYLWILEQDGSFYYREKIWEDDQASITNGHIHIGSVLEICSNAVFFLRNLSRYAALSSRYCLRLRLGGMRGRSIVAQPDHLPSDVLRVDGQMPLSSDDQPRDHHTAVIEVALNQMIESPLTVVYSLVAEVVREVRPDLADIRRLERQLRYRHASDSRRGGIRFLGYLDPFLHARPMRRAVVSVNNERVGLVVETPGGGSRFTYDPDYLVRSHARPLSPRMPLRSGPYESVDLLPFFENLLPQGAQLEALVHQRGLQPHDKFGILLATLPSSVGGLQIHQEERIETP